MSVSRQVINSLNPVRPKATSLEIERENFEKNQQLSVSKAINSAECPVKEKHVRKLVLGTHQTRSSMTFWNSVRSGSLEENPIVCWKFCHVLHKLLRDGHTQTLIDSYRHIRLLEHLGKLWGHLKEAFGKLIQNYCKLLVRKVTFHINYQLKFPGNLAITDEQLDQIGDQEIRADVLFQLACDIFDYLEDLLTLQSNIFASLDPSRANSMTNAGQCRLAPLIPMIQDSSYLYDYSVKILFKLHKALPASTLEGHRNRFNLQFRVLKKFYINSSQLQYFRNLIQVPLLPDNPPNFLCQSDLQSHVTPVVTVAADQDDGSPNGSEVTDTLIDLSHPPPPAPGPANTMSDTLSVDSISLRSYPMSEQTIHSSNGFGSQIEEKNQMINRLSTRINELHNEMQTMKLENDRRIERLQAQLTDQEAARAELDRLLSQMKLEKEMVQLELEDVRSELSRYKEQGGTTELELEKSRHNFNIIKEAYNKMRSEHLELLRSRKIAPEPEPDISKDIGDQLKQELQEMESAIQEGVSRIQQMLELSKKVDTGVKLEVNKNVLNSCTSLMEAIVQLIRDSRKLQDEIVAQGKGSASVTEFYQRNHRWTEGLISAAKVVAVAAKMLVDAADKVVSGKGKVSELMASSHEIAAATAQLVVASRVKADPKSEKLTKLASSSKVVTEATASVVATAKDMSQKLDEFSDSVDLSSLSLHQAKKKEFESQVKMIELQTALDKERVTLAELRKKHYQLAGSSGGWDQ